MPADLEPPPGLAAELLTALAIDERRAVVAQTQSGDLWRWSGGGWRRLAYRAYSMPSALAMSSDGQLLAAGNDRGEVWVWLVSSGDLLIKLVGAQGPISSLAWSADAGELVAGSLDGAARRYAASPDALARVACGLLRDAPATVAESCARRSMSTMRADEAPNLDGVGLFTDDD